MQLVRDQRVGGLVRYRLLEDVGELMRVPDEIRKCVAFLWYKNARGEGRLAGTAFFVSVGAESEPGINFIYLVTAKHVIAAARANSSEGTIYLRVNLIEGGSTSVRSALDTWRDHPGRLFC
jgi:hypothetical protein